MSQYETATAETGAYGASHGGTPVVTFENVSKQYGRLRAVDGLTLDLRPGETVALLGPNGAGKSTSLDMLLALRKPTGGRIRMFGEDPYHAVKSGRVGAMLQSGGLMPEVTVRELVELITKLHPNPEPVDTTLKRAGIAQFADQRVDRLSGGQTQRVRFALAEEVACLARGVGGDRTGEVGGAGVGGFVGEYGHGGRRIARRYQIVRMPLARISRSAVTSGRPRCTAVAAIIRSGKSGTFARGTRAIAAVKSS